MFHSTGVKWALFFFLPFLTENLLVTGFQFMSNKFGRIGTLVPIVITPLCSYVGTLVILHCIL